MLTELSCSLREQVLNPALKVIGEMRDNTDATNDFIDFLGVSVFNAAVAEGWRTYQMIALNLDNSIVYIDTFQASLMWIVVLSCQRQSFSCLESREVRFQDVL